MSGKPYPSALSGMLVAHFPRSRQIKTRVKGAPMISAGYKVSDPGKADHIRVEWILGDQYRSTPTDCQLSITQEKLSEVQKFLEEWNYPVRRSGLHCSAGESDKWNWLEVFGKNTSPK